MVGPGAGLVTPDGLEDWKRTAWLVARDTLDEAMIREHEVAMPEAELDALDTPKLAALAARAPLVEVDEPTYDALVRRGARGHVVSGVRTAGGYGYASGAGAVVETSTDDWSRKSGTHEAPEPDAFARFGDRFLRAASAGAIDEGRVLLASVLADAVEDPHRALELEVNLPEPSSEDEALARAIVRAILEAPADADEVAVPHYGRALRVRLPALVLTGRRGVLTELSPFDLWHVEDVAPPPRVVSVARPRVVTTPARRDVGGEKAMRPLAAPPAPAPAWQRALAALVLLAILVAMAWALSIRAE